MVLKFRNKDREIPLSIGYYALKRYQVETGKSFKSVDLEDLPGLEVLIWHGIEAGYKHNNEENPFKREDMDILLDESLFEILALIPDFFPRPQGATTEGTGITSGEKPERMN